MKENKKQHKHENRNNTKREIKKLIEDKGLKLNDTEKEFITDTIANSLNKEFLPNIIPDDTNQTTTLPLEKLQECAMGFVSPNPSSEDEAFTKGTNDFLYSCDGRFKDAVNESKGYLQYMQNAMNRLQNYPLDIMKKEEEKEKDDKINNIAKKVIDRYNELTNTNNMVSGTTNVTTPQYDTTSVENILESILNLYKKKNSDYGNSFEKSFLRYNEYGPNEGLKYAVGRLGDKYTRIENLAFSNKEQFVTDESIKDTLLDLATYAILTLAAMNK